MDDVDDVDDEDDEEDEAVDVAVEFEEVKVEEEEVEEAELEAGVSGAEYTAIVKAAPGSARVSLSFVAAIACDGGGGGSVSGGSGA